MPSVSGRFTGGGAGLRGAREMQTRLRRISAQYPKEVKPAIHAETKIDFVEVYRKTPIEEGDLRASEKIEGPFQEGKKIWTQITAGGPDAEHALIVHEDLEAFHDIGMAKYLESVINESAPFYAARIAARISLRRMVR